MRPLRRHVARLLKAGQACGVPTTAGVCREGLKVSDALWTFVRVEGLAPTNNVAERAIRPGVLWRKGSFGTQGASGARCVEAMMTVVTTLKQQQAHRPCVYDRGMPGSIHEAACPLTPPSSHRGRQRPACRRMTCKTSTVTDAKAPNCRKNKVFKDLDHYAKWLTVADAVIKAPQS